MIIMKRNIYIILILFLFVTIYKLYVICYKDSDIYKKKYDYLTNRKVSFPSSERGRILDRNGKVLVDNIGINTLIYNKLESNDEEDVKNALKIAKIIDIDYDNIDELILKRYYLKLNNDGNNLITKKEKKLYKERKIDLGKINKLKLKRITGDMLGSLTDTEKKASVIYDIISKGYSYEDKIIKSELTDEEIASLNDTNIKGTRIELRWERLYPYGDTLKSIFGSVGNITKEVKSHYKDLPLDSTVGISYLEYYYDDYLRGIDPEYEIINNKLVLVKKGKKGKDLKLSIDIDLQLKLEEILKEEMLNAKKASNSKFYNHSYSIIGNPSTGEILAASGLLVKDGTFHDITSNIINSSYTVGSVVKGATISVGYKNGLIKEGEYVNDSCIKVYGVKEKCSWKRLGRINDLNALAYSSNYYQFLIATRLTNPSYTWNSKLNADIEDFNMYRDSISEFGLGAITGVDLPGETSGIKGKGVKDDLLLNLAIGQYDSYTPIELYQYISTIANNGVRVKPSFGNNKNKIINEIDVQNVHLDRIKKGLREVMIYGTGKNYTDHSFSSAGKTGTSETFIDSDGDGKMDTKTISTAFVMFAPYDDPKYSFVIMSPNLAVAGDNHTYKYAINLQVTRKITKYLFQNS